MAEALKVATALLAISALTLALNFTSLIQPYQELENIYNTIASRSDDYRANTLRTPFQSNIKYLVFMAQIRDLVEKMKSVYEDFLNASAEISRLEKLEPTFKTVFQILSNAQRAKIDLALLKMFYQQLSQLVEQMKDQMPAATCKGNEIYLVKSLLNAKNTLEYINIKKVIKQQNGGLNELARCVVREEIRKTYLRFLTFSEEFKKELSKMEEKVKYFDSLVELLTPSGG